ncbi:hypothetical protein [Bradyrhizobium prioriisuperbiae]|uniref:hypothetical protein n=1 Tax=Bradyrhizobium prioriisuperbiae TaxID=2854389 RepID=UPI0028E54F4A|nr:hypothetical protein [Bradyrhizobium prioritasuperba]
MKNKNGGRAVIKGKSIVITFHMSALQSALDGWWFMGKVDTRYKITDMTEFSKDFVNALNAEDERGTTMIHEMADQAFLNCIEGGAFGIEEHEDQEI